MWYRLLIPPRLLAPLGYLNLMIHHNVTALIKFRRGLHVAPLKEHLKQNGSCGQEEEEEEDEEGLVRWGGGTKHQHILFR